MARLLLLVPTTSYRISDFLSAAHRLDIEVAVGSERRQVLEKYADGGTVTLSFQKPERAIGQIREYHARFPLAAIVPTDEETTLLASRAAAALGLPHNPPEAVAAAGNKLLFRQTMAAAGTPGPAFSVISPDQDWAAPATEPAYPCVLKPLSLSASQGVIRVDDPSQFLEGLARIHRILEALDHVGPRDILVEAYLPGPEVALEGLLDRGALRVLAIFDKPDPLDGPYFEETIYVTPSRLPRGQQGAIEAATSRAVAALGLQNGPIHAELRLSPQGPVVIELAARSIGGLCGRALKFGVGPSLEDLILRHAMGLPIDSMARDGAAAGVMMIPIPRRGRLVAVEGLARAESVSGIEAVTITIARGQPVVPLPEGNRYLGFIFASADTPSEVEAALRAAHSSLDIRIES
ncbi:MAG: ATP-grasp domain-containing protein [Pseudomonadota bacterium]